MANYSENETIAQFNITIDKWIMFLDDYTLEMLLQRPNLQSWSLGQVYVHIIVDTQYYAGQIKNILIAGNINCDKEMHPFAKSMFINSSFPDMALENPNNRLDLEQPQSKDHLLQELLLIKKEINELSATYDFSASKGKSEHPAFLFFNAQEWLGFAEMHMRHHFWQKQKIDDEILNSGSKTR